MFKGIFYKLVSMALVVVFLFFSPACSFCSSAGSGLITPGEYWRLMKNTISYIGTQIGTVFSGSVQDLILNEQAFKEWAADRYTNGVDGTPWNLEDYYTKECVRNPDGTFTLSDKLVDDTVAWIKEVLDTNSGYYLVKTKSLNNVSPAEFNNKYYYDAFVRMVKDCNLFYFIGCSSSNLSYSILDGYKLVFTSHAVSSGTYNDMQSYNDNWNEVKLHFMYLDENGVVTEGSNYSYTLKLDRVVTENGDYIKVFKTYNHMKEYNVGFQPYYVGEKYLNYDSSQDNSIKVDSDTLNNNNWVTNNNDVYNNVSNTVINNNTTNITNGGSGLTEEEIKNIVDSILDSYKPDSGGGSDSGDGGGSGGGDGGSSGGLTAILEALGKLLDFLLTAIGKALSVVLDFLTKALGLLDGLSGFTGPFTAFLSAIMPFIPQEVWDVIIAGMTLSVIAVGLKIFKS